MWHVKCLWQDVFAPAATATIKTSSVWAQWRGGVNTILLSKGRIASHQSKCKEAFGRGKWCLNPLEKKKGIIFLGMVQGLAYEWGKALLVLSWQTVRHRETESTNVVLQRKDLTTEHNKKREEKRRSGTTWGKKKNPKKTDAEKWRDWKNSEEWAQRIILLVTFRIGMKRDEKQVGFSWSLLRERK